MQKETWLAMPNCDGKYEVSNLGRIRSTWIILTVGGGTYQKRVNRIKYLNPHKDRNGYLRPSICFNGSDKLVYLHRIVAECFVPKIEGKNFVNHKDGNPGNNCAENLEWCTQAENMTHAFNVLGAPKIKPPGKGSPIICKPVIWVKDSGEEVRFNSVAEAGEKLNINFKSISNVINGWCKTASGLRFKRA